MAAGSVTAAALRHRPRQAVLLVVLSAVVTAAAALGPLYARAVEQSVLRNVVADATPAQRTLVVADASDEPASPRQLARAVRGRSRPQFGTPIGRRRGAGPLSGPGTATRRGPADQPGRPVRAPDRVRRPLPARRRASCCQPPFGRDTGLAPGSRGDPGRGDPGNGGVQQQATVVGLYEAVDVTDAVLAGRGRAARRARSGAEEQSR